VRKFYENYLLLTVGALFAHLWLIWVGLHGIGTPMGDVLFAYKPWVDWMLDSGKLLGINAAWVYPYPAQIPIWISVLINPNDFQTGWLTMITALDLIAISALVRFGRRDEQTSLRYAAAWFWIFFLMALGPVSISRIDAFSVVLAIFGVLALVSRKLNPSTGWLTFAGLTKIWTIAFVAPILVISKHRMRVLVAVGVTGVITLGLGLLLGGNQHLFGFITDQQGRGLQIEAPVATPFIWAGLLGFGDGQIYYDQAMMTFQVAGAGTAEVASLMNAALFIALVITCFLAWRAARAGRHFREILPIASLTAVLDLIFFNKVGSPQYVTWLAVPIILGILYRTEKWRTPIYAVTAIAILTELVYPVFYDSILAGQTFAMTFLLLRNLVYLALLVYANLRLSSLAKASVAGQPLLAQ
jgi:hypothetical protein